MSLTERLKRIWGFGLLVFIVLGTIAYWTERLPGPLIAGAQPAPPAAIPLLRALGIRSVSDLLSAVLIATLVLAVVLSIRAVVQERRTVLLERTAGGGNVSLEVEIDRNGNFVRERGSGRRRAEEAPPASGMPAGAPTGSSPLSRSVETLLNCMRNDVLDPDAYFNQAVAGLRAEGADGSRALAGLLREMLTSRTAGISWALAAAAKVEAVAELEEAVGAVASAAATTDAGGGGFTPEIFGGGRIGWTDSTHARVRELAGKALEEIRKSQVPGAPPGPGVSQPAAVCCCEHCGKAVESTIPVELRSPDGSRSRSLNVCDACLEDLASGAIQVRFE